jgi:hypothetical protein
MNAMLGRILVMTALSAYGQQSTFAGENGIVAQVVDGDVWRTSISLNNIEVTPSRYKLSFFQDSGAPLALSTNLGTSSAIYGTIPARGSVTITTTGTAVALLQGWARMESLFLPPGESNFTAASWIAGTALFIRPPTVARPTEVSEPLDFSLSSQWVLPFDHTSGYATGVALVNPQGFLDITVFLTLYDESGNQIGLSSLTLPHNNHTAFTLADVLPAAAGRRGTLRIDTSGTSVNVLGLRFSPSGMTSATSPTSWF